MIVGAVDHPGKLARNAFADLVRAMAVVIGQQSSEFFTTDARQNRVRVGTGANHARERSQHLVAVLCP